MKRFSFLACTFLSCSVLSSPSQYMLYVFIVVAAYSLLEVADAYSKVDPLVHQGQEA